MQDDPDPMLAGLGTRLAAYVVDTVLGYSPFIPLVGVVVVYDILGEVPEDPPPVFLVLALVALLVALAFAIYQWFLISTTGQTVGKRLFGIRIVRLDGSPVDFFVGVVLRSWVLGFLTGVLNQCCLGWVLFGLDTVLIFGPDRQCLHDRLAGTRVIVDGGAP